MENNLGNIINHRVELNIKSSGFWAIIGVIINIIQLLISIFYLYMTITTLDSSQEVTYWIIVLSAAVSIPSLILYVFTINYLFSIYQFSRKIGIENKEDTLVQYLSTFKKYCIVAICMVLIWGLHGVLQFLITTNLFN